MPNKPNQLTILLSPVMLDSSMAREWQLINTPSAGTCVEYTKRLSDHDAWSRKATQSNHLSPDLLS